MTREQKNARAREKRRERKMEAEQLYAAREARLYSEGQKKEARRLEESARNAALLEQVHAKMRSPEFRAWYEATTGEDVAEFLAEVAISRDEYRERYCREGWYVPQLDWTQQIIEAIAEKNPWTNPEMKPHWAQELQTCPAKKRRGILIRLATPRWASQEKIIAAYRERDRITRETGVPHEVDHIYPIVSQVVCGLHCEFNLRVIPESENRSKSNNIVEIRHAKD